MWFSFSNICNTRRSTSVDCFAKFLNKFLLNRVHSNFRPTCFIPDRRPKTSISKSLGIHEWSVNFAPSPKNIIWYEKGEYKNDFSSNLLVLQEKYSNE